MNIFMLHGGNNFGYFNGANHEGIYKSHVTSYDYDAPLDEAGHPTSKFYAFKAVLARHGAVPAEDPAPAVSSPAFSVDFTERVALAEVRKRLGTWRSSAAAPAMVDLGHYRGFCVYRTRLPGRAAGVLRVDGVRDRAQVSVDGRAVGTLERDRHDRAIALPPGDVLELLVENRGRVSYGPSLGERKGLIGPVTLDGRALADWDVLPLDLDSVGSELFTSSSPVSGPVAGPTLVRAEFTLDEPIDLFLDTATWGKGVAWIIGFNLGRYWTRGPQRTLFVPAGEVRPGANELVVLELHALAEPRAAFVPGPLLGQEEE